MAHNLTTQVRESGSSELHHQATWHEPKFSVETLKPDHSYTASVRAMHERGKSAPVQVGFDTTPRPPEQEVAPETVRANCEWSFR